MAKRSETRDERLSILMSRKLNMEAVGKLESLLFKNMLEAFVGPLSLRCTLQRLECAHLIARRYSSQLTAWAAFQANGLPDVSHDPDEFTDYFNEKQTQLKEHAEALLALLKNNHFPPAISSVIGATQQGYLQADGRPAFRTLERSLEARLTELIRSIDLPNAEKGRSKSRKGKGAARAEAIQAVLHMWLEIGGPPPKLQRDGSAGKSCGPFNDFAAEVLEAFGIKHNGLEDFVRAAQQLFGTISESQLERLRNQ